MTHDEAGTADEVAGVFERHLFDGETIRDDIAEVCIAIDDALSPEPRVRKNSRAVAEAVAE